MILDRSIRLKVLYYLLRKKKCRASEFHVNLFGRRKYGTRENNSVIFSVKMSLQDINLPFVRFCFAKIVLRHGVVPEVGYRQTKSVHGDNQIR